MTKIRIVAAVVDTRQLLMYRDDGSTITLKQGDPRVAELVAFITPIISNGGVAEIDELVSPETFNVFNEFEKQSGGFVRFFQVAKSKVASFFGAGPEKVEPMKIGEIPAVPKTSSKLDAALDDIMANAMPPAADPDMRSKDSTVVGVVTTPSGERKVIPAMDSIEKHMEYALKLGSTEGVKRFLERISAVINDRQHSVHDLLRFMSLGDLPIADDGSIIIYKVLRGKDGKYVDCHTGKVTQRIGSLVCMSPSLVDHNRRNECSNGLHVARRGYIKGFSGDVCVIAKLAPEDVIAVPNYDANKMRVCAYHILFELPHDAYQALRQNRAMTDVCEKAQKMLARAISGDHVGIIERVEITGHKGEGLVITPVSDANTAAVETANTAQTKHPSKTKVKPMKAIEIDPKKPAMAAPVVDPKKVAAEVTAAKQANQAENQNGNGRQAQARAFYQAGDLDGLLRFKRTVKVSWEKLGFTPKEIDKITSGKLAKPKPKAQPLPFPTGNRREIASALRAQGRFAELEDFRKKAKVSWRALGFDDTQIAIITDALKG